MIAQGKKFVEEATKDENDLFTHNLIKLSKMVDDGLLNSSGAKQVFHVMNKRHHEVLAAIETLGEMITE